MVQSCPVFASLVVLLFLPVSASAQALDYGVAEAVGPVMLPSTTGEMRPSVDAWAFVSMGTPLSPLTERGLDSAGSLLDPSFNLYLFDWPGHLPDKGFALNLRVVSPEIALPIWSASIIEAPFASQDAAAQFTAVPVIPDGVYQISVDSGPWIAIDPFTTTPPNGTGPMAPGCPGESVMTASWEELGRRPADASRLENTSAYHEFGIGGGSVHFQGRREPISCGVSVADTYPEILFSVVAPTRLDGNGNIDWEYVMSIEGGGKGSNSQGAKWRVATSAPYFLLGTPLPENEAPPGRLDFVADRAGIPSYSRNCAVALSYEQSVAVDLALLVAASAAAAVNPGLGLALSAGAALIPSEAFCHTPPQYWVQTTSTDMGNAGLGIKYPKSVAVIYDDKMLTRIGEIDGEFVLPPAGIEPYRYQIQAYAGATMSGAFRMCTYCNTASEAYTVQLYSAPRLTVVAP